MVEREMDDPISKISWALRGAQVAFAFFCMALLAAMISFDNEYTSSNILPNIEIFVAVLSMPFAAAIVVIPYLYQRNGKLKALAVALRHVRFEFVLSAIWACLWAVVSLANSIYLGVRECDPFDPQFNKTRKEHGEAFTDRLSGKCNIGRVGLVFGWLALLAWVGSLGIVAKEWYDNRRPTNQQDQQRIRPTGVPQMSSASVQESGLPAGTSLEEYKIQSLGSPEPQHSQQPALPLPPPPHSPPLTGYSSPPLTGYSSPPAFSSPQYPPAPLPPPIPPSHISPLQIPQPQHQQSTSTTQPGDVTFPMPRPQQ